MSIAAVTVLLCSLVAASAAAPSYQEHFQTAEIQSHFTAPSRGCVEINYHLSGVTYRSYLCDGPQGACVVSFNPTCDVGALYHRANADHQVIVRGRQHTLRYYNQIGGACYLTLVPTCCTSEPVVMQVNGNCRCVDLPYGERLCDPVDCESAGRKLINQQFLEDQLLNLQERT